jgi:tetraacyldisaccharide 4'-kinase
MRKFLERYFNEIWYGESRPGVLLRVMSGLYTALWAKRLVRPTVRPPVPVIVVGNLTVGGGGKTPLVIALAGHLRERGLNVAVISRGYGGAEPTDPEKVSPDGDPGHYGDEPVEIAQACPVPVWVCRSRKAALGAAVDAGAEVVVADDGLQHGALPRSFEICVVDGVRGLGNRQTLPAGPLRQSISRIAAVDLVMIKGGNWRWPSGLRYQLEPVGAGRLDGSDERPLEEWSGMKVDALCGVANPDGFFALLDEAGIGIRTRRALPDHHHFGPDDLAGLEGPVLVTAKDAVKLSRLDLSVEVRVVRVAARVPAGALERLDDHLKEFSGGQ